MSGDVVTRYVYVYIPGHHRAHDDRKHDRCTVADISLYATLLHIVGCLGNSQAEVRPCHSLSERSTWAHNCALNGRKEKLGTN